MRNPKESFPLLLPEHYPSEIIYQALSATKNMNHQRQIKKSRAAFFTGLIQKIAKGNTL